jgi:simple sugar transport system permease protein
LARNPTASADYGGSYVLLVIFVAALWGTNPKEGLSTLALQIDSSEPTAIRLSPCQYAIAPGVIMIVVMVVGQLHW